MSNGALEIFLARLYTDVDFLEQFLKDRQSTAHEAGLSNDQAQAVTTINEEALRLAALSFHKARIRPHRRRAE
jgi:hypothetical protein